MLARLLQTWNTLSGSFWFIPTLMSLAAALLSLALTRVDIALGTAWIQAVPWGLHIRADGARGLLSTVAGSMIGVAGVTFSITIAALAYTTSTLGPRLLTNFMDDTGNQITLGTFVSTFVYCLLLLRTITSGGDSGADEFVPYLALLFAMLFTGAGIGVLIYYIHHITESLHVSNVTAQVARGLNTAIDRYAARARQNAGRPTACLPAYFNETAVAIRSDAEGYIQNLVYATLVRQARTHDLVLRLERSPGDFVVAGQVLLYAWPASRINAEVAADLCSAYAHGAKRTQSQDALFLANELVEIGARALSAGINDPYTAMNCLDWLSAALIRLAQDDIGSLHYYDDNDRLRLWLPRFNFQTLALSAFDQLRPYFVTDRNAALHMFAAIGSIGEFTRPADHRQLLREQIAALQEGVLPSITSARDRDQVKQACRTALHRLKRSSDTSGLNAIEKHWSPDMR